MRDRAAAGHGTGGVGVALPFASEAPGPVVSAMARAAEEAGATSLWCSDHIVQVADIRSIHTFSPDGKADWPGDTPWPEALTSMTWLAASSHRATVGTNVLVLPQRDPVLVAKTAATIDRLSGGRAVLGVGVGWMREEFEALGWDFATRGRRMDEAIAVMRSCWKGDVEGFAGEFFTVPDVVRCYPTPVRAEGVPILIGGSAPPALRRVGRLADGWVALEMLAAYDDDALRRLLDRLARDLEVIEAARPAGGRPLRHVMTIGDLEERLLPFLRPLIDLGFAEIVIDGSWDPDQTARDVASVVDALG